MKDIIKQFKQFIDLISAGILVINREYTIEDANQGISNILGLNKDEIIGRKCYKVLKRLDKPCKPKFCPVHNVITIKESIKIPYNLHNSFRSKKYLNISCAPLKKHGDIFGVLWICEDITDRVIAEKKLKEAYYKLKEVDKIKSNIIANVSHELKTPLTIALGMIDLINLVNSEEERKKYLNRAKKALIRQNYIIDNLIKFSRVEKGKHKLNIERFNLKEVIERCIKEKEDIIFKKNVKIILKVPDIEMEGDPRDIKHVISCLIDNAIKFNKQNGIVFINAEVYKNDENKVIVDIEDTGIGIREEDIDNIFSPLTQLDDSPSRKYSGTGMGLAVAKKIIEMHNGTIKVESRYREGSKFIISLPIQQNVGLKNSNKIKF